MKINGLSVDHFKAGVITGPLSWITKGTLDLDLHLWIPQAHPTDDLLDLIRTEVTDLKETALDSIERMVVNHPERESVRGVFERKAEARRREMWERKRKKARREMRDYGTMAPQDVGSEEPAAVVLSTDTNGTPETAKTHKTTPIPPVPTGPPSLVMFWTVKMNNFKASVPLKPKALSYMSSALIRPVVAFMNSNRTQLEISFDAKMDIVSFPTVCLLITSNKDEKQTNFNGAWDVYTAGLAQILSEELGRALLSLTQDEKERRRRLYQIGLWSIQSVTKQLMEVIEYTRTLGRNATAALGSGVV